MTRSISTKREPGAWRRFEAISIRDAAQRVAGVVRRTRLLRVDAGDERIELRLKLENEQETGAFKARGAWNQVSRLDDTQRESGVVCTSSGNHGRALSWAAKRGGVHATICMPQDAYPNKIQACRDEGAEVVLCKDRAAAERECEARVAAGSVLVHPYNAERTLQGAGTVGLEIAEEWPEVELCLVPVGGGGLLAGSSLALRGELGEDVLVFGVEPEGAPSMTRGLEAGEAVLLDAIETNVQGLCPPGSGSLNVEICSTTVDEVHLVRDADVFAAQARLVRAGHQVEPAGAAASSLVFSSNLPNELLAARTAENPLRVCAVVSGGNADPAQLAALKEIS